MSDPIFEVETEVQEPEGPVVVEVTDGARDVVLGARAQENDPEHLALWIEVSGATCTTARSVASKYARDPYSVDLPSHRTKTVSGWRCIWTADPQVAQQVMVGCTRAGARISFADRLPNG